VCLTFVVMTDGQRLMKWRLARGISRQNLAKTLAVSRQTILAWETGTWQPSEERWPQIARALGLPAPKQPKRLAPIPVPPATRVAQ